MTKHIGIVGCSAEGAALCYRTICAEAPQFMGDHAHPEITMHTHPLSEYMEYIYKDDWRGVAELMLSSAAKLAQAGAEFAISPDNTIHQAFNEVEKSSPIPWIHIVDAVAKEAKQYGYKKLALTGTKYLMTGPVYPEILNKFGMQVLIPDSKNCEKIDSIIFSELVYGKFMEESRLYFNKVIQDLKDQGCAAVILGCTEIPLLVDPSDCPLPTLDSTRLLARAALKHALE